MMAVKWTDSVTVQLIKLWESNPAIWDTRHPDYVDRNKARACILDICRAMCLTEDEVKRKLKCLRTQYVQQLHVLSSSSRNGGSVSTGQESNWKFFSLLGFLRPCIQLQSAKNDTDNRAQLRRMQLLQENSQLQDEQEGSLLQGDESDVKEEEMVEMVGAAEPQWQNIAQAPYLQSSTSCTSRASPSLQLPVSFTSPPAPSPPMLPSQPVLDTVAQEATCSRPSVSQKRKRSTDTMYVVKAVTPKRPGSGDHVESENELFFKMLAHKVSRLPIPQQDRLRRTLYNLVADEQEFCPE